MRSKTAIAVRYELHKNGDPGQHHGSSHQAKGPKSEKRREQRRWVGDTAHDTAIPCGIMSTQEDGPAGSASQPEVIDDTEDAPIDGSSSSSVSGRGIGASSGSTGGSGSSPAITEPAAPRSRRGTINTSTVGKRSFQVIDLFLQANLPKSSQPAMGSG